MARSRLVLLAAVGGAVILGLIAWYVLSSGKSGNLETTGSTSTTATDVSSSDMALGSPKAPVKVIEYGAPSCPVCAHFEADNFEPLKKNYIDTGKVYFVFRVFPINGDADGAAEGLARCAGRTSVDSYFHFIDLLFRNQKEWDPEYNPPDVHAGLLMMARIAGIEAEADPCMTDKANAERINNVAKEATARYNLNATPTLIINGVVEQPGYIPWTTLKAMLDAALQHAHK